MKHVFLVVGFLFLSSLMIAQKGEIVGKIIDAKTGESITGAIVQVEGSGLGASSDLDGEFKISIAPGTYTVECRLVSYAGKKISDVVVAAGKSTQLNISLEEAVLEGQVVEIIDYRRTNTEASLLIEMKDAKGVASGVSNQTIAKTQDRNAAEVARRIPGVTLLDNRFVMVRGLTQRYNAVMLNNVLVPSMEADERAFSFDVIPSAAIDRFLIFKSPSPDLPGEFSGGAIKVTTRDFPDSDFTLDYNAGVGFRKGTTGKDFNSNYTSNTEWMGFDRSRMLPSAFPDNAKTLPTAAERQAAGRMLNNTWDYQTEKASPDFTSALGFGKRIKLRDAQLGSFTAINYSHRNNIISNQRNDYNTYDNIMQKSDTVFAFNDQNYVKTSNVGLMQNFAFKSKRHSIEFKNFLNQAGMQSNVFRTGRSIEDGNYRKEYSYQYNQRTMLSTQLAGNHDLFAKRGNLSWILAYGSTDRQDPDWRRIRYTKPFDGSQSYYSAYVPAPNSPAPFFLGRIFLDLHEDIRTVAGNYEHKLINTSKDEDPSKWITVKAGIYLEDKDRYFRARNLGYTMASSSQHNFQLDSLPLGQILADENLNGNTGFKISEKTEGSDSYHASNNLQAYYLMMNVPINKWIFTGGVRAEKNMQRLQSISEGKNVSVVSDSVLWLPSANLSYNFSKKALVRAAYGKTVNRPEFRELAPYSFYNFERNFIYQGQPSLKFATVANYDVRYEYYPNPTELISVGVFAKKFINPIENYFVPGGGSGGTRSFTPGNALSATGLGMEVDMRKSLQNVTTKNWVHNFSVVANASYIKSKIKVSEDGLETGLNSNRAMLGQSPYIVNMGVFYQDDSLGLQLTALYNVVGPRINIVGIPGVPEVYEMQRNVVDLSVTKRFKNGISVRVGVQDLLNQNQVFLQDANNDGVLSKSNDQVMQVTNRGALYSFAVGYRFAKK